MGYSNNATGADHAVIWTVSTPPLTPTSTSTQPLSVAASPTTVKVGTPTSVTFAATSGGRPVSGATVVLSGEATGSGTTDESGNAVITVDAAAAGTISAMASKSGYNVASVNMTAPGFEAVFVIVGMIVVAYMLRRRG